MSRASGAGAYVQSDGTGARSWRRSTSPTSIHREVVGRLVRAGLLLADLHEHVVQERGGAEAEQVWRHPVEPQRLVQQHEVLDGLLRGADPTRGLHSHLAAGLLVHV